MQTNSVDCTEFLTSVLLIKSLCYSEKWVSLRLLITQVLREWHECPIFTFIVKVLLLSAFILFFARYWFAFCQHDFDFYQSISAIQYPFHASITTWRFFNITVSDRRWSNRRLPLRLIIFNETFSSCLVFHFHVRPMPFRTSVSSITS